MIIIALEGLDKSGKATQVKLIAERLRTEGYRVAEGEFHRYDTPTGRLIMKWLQKEWNVDQKTIELIMAADKQAQQAMFQLYEEEGVDILILDRYMLSQSVYSEANGIPADWEESLQRFMRHPNMNIVIDIPADVSMLRKGKHNNGINDRYESDWQLLNRIRKLYKESSGVRIVDGLLTIEEVHDRIYSEIQLKLLV